MAFPKIMGHKHKDLIVKLLLEGRGVRYVSKTLKEMYPEDKSMHVSVPTLQAFRKEHLKLEGDALEEIKKAKRKKEIDKEKKREHTKVRNLPSYRKKLEEVVDLHVDIKKSLAQIDTLIRARLEDFFDRAQEGTASIKEEQLLQGYFDRYFTLLDKWAKYVDKLADHRVEQNVNITIINEQMALLRSAVHNVIMNMDPEAALRFTTELGKEMEGLSYRHDSPSLEELNKDVALLADAEFEEA